MKATFDRGVLAEAVACVSGAVSHRTTLPALSCIRFDVRAGRASLSATDIYSTATWELSEGIAVRQAGTILVPADQLVKAIRAETGDLVQMQTQETSVVIRCGGRRVSLATVSPEDWPKDSQLPTRSTPVIGVEAQLLAQGLSAAALCASHDEGRPVLTTTALFVQEGSDTLEIVATDTYRLGMVRLAMTDRAPFSCRILLPAQVATQMAKGLSKVRGTAIVGVNDPLRPTEMLLRANQICWQARLVEGEFPNWAALIPQRWSASADLDASEIRAIIKSVNAVRSKRSKEPLCLDLNPHRCVARFVADGVTLEEPLVAANFDPNGIGPIQVGLNPGYLADALKFTGSARVKVLIQDDLKPLLFDSPDRRYLLMPMRKPA